MDYFRLEKFVSLKQGLAINAGTAHLVSDYKTEEFIYPLLRIADMEKGIYSKYISKDVSDSVVAKKDDIIYTRTGQIGLAFMNKHGVVHNNCFVVEVTSDEIDKLYLFAILQSEFVRNQAIALSRSSVQPDLTHDMFKSIVIPLPTLNEQRKIAETYIMLTKFIENNKAINTELEATAKTIYDYWFLQFEFPNENGKPYKSSGGKMVWNEELKTEIPLGWEVKCLADILKKNATSFDYASTQPTIDLSVMPSDSIALSQLNTSDNFSTNLYKMKKGDILFGSIRPYLHKAGFAPCDGAVAGTVHSYSVKTESDYNFALITVSRNAFFDYAVNVSAGTKMPVVNSDSILAYKVPYNSKIVSKFNDIILMDTIATNIQENQELSALRDFLLPLLMNGQVTFKEN